MPAQELGRELYGRLAKLAEHLGKIGSGLNTTVDAYNRALGSYESRVLASARKFTDLGVASEAALERPAAVEKIAATPLVRAVPSG